MNDSSADMTTNSPSDNKEAESSTDQSPRPAPPLPSEVELGHYRDAISSVESTLEKLRECPPAEREQLHHDIAQLQDMYSKVSSGRIEIVIFGEISTGKSALINALVGRDVAEVDVQGGWTTQIRKESWDTCEYRVPGAEDSEIILVDTPGINEVGGKDRAEMAEATARRADLILFVTDSDLNDTEYAALVELAAIQKPIIVVFNKSDLYESDDFEKLMTTVKRRVEGLVPPEHFVITAADPRKIEYVTVDDAGNEKSEWRKPDSQIEELKERILQTFEKEGLELLALNAAMFAADKSDRVATLRIKMRNKRADQVIWTMAITKAVTVAANPVPIVDVVGGVVVDAVLIATLSKVYGLNFSMSQSRQLAKAIAKAAGMVALAQIPQIGASFFKAITGTLGTALVALPQGAAAGYGSYIIGLAAKHYFEHGASWGDQLPKTVVKSILDQNDKESVLNHLKEEIRKKLSWNRHATG